MAKIVRWGSSQKHANCFDQGFKCFCISYFRKNKNTSYVHPNGLL